MFLVTIHTFTVSYSSRRVLQCVYISGILIHHPVVYFPLGFFQHVDSWSLIGPCLDVLLALCQLQILLERMGVVHCSFTQECNTIGERALFKLVRCFFTSVFLVFSMRPYGLPKTLFLPIMDGGNGYQGGETFLSRAAKLVFSSVSCFNMT